MKKIFLSFIFIGIVCLSYAQSSVYHPFPTTTAVWRSLHTSSMGTNDTYYRQMQGDTVIGSYNYKKIYSIFGSTLYYAYALRQDIPNKKVYLLDGTGVEVLWFDFNMSVGDTIMFNAPMNDTLYVASIDSVQVGSDYHKAFRIASVNPMMDPADIIEGVGYTSDFSYNYDYTFENSWSLQCFSEENVRQYPMYPMWPYQCLMTVGIGEQQGDLFDLVVYPNPLQDAAVISVGCNENYRIEIINAQGEIVLTKDASGNSFAGVDVSELTSGIYFVKLTNQKGSSAVKKIVKQ
jgi:type IX secretion system substrate protein